MIIISREGQPLEIIKTWDDLFSRPKLQRPVDPQEVKLEDIIGYYRLPPIKHKCALTSCGTPHFTGYLVQLGGGMETYIGQYCGHREFEIVFDQFVRQFRARLNVQKSRENIREQQNRVASARRTVEALRSGEFGADDLYNRMHRQVTKLFDDRTVNQLKERAKAGNAIVARVRELSQEEIDDLKVIGDDRTTEETPVFTIAGLRAVIDHPKLRTILQVQLGTELETFEDLEPENMDQKDLRTWSNWSNRIDIRLKAAKDIMEDCKRFLVPSNLQNINGHKALL